jgi:hypothetical protein
VGKKIAVQARLLSAQNQESVPAVQWTIRLSKVGVLIRGIERVLCAGDAECQSQNGK